MWDLRQRKKMVNYNESSNFNADENIFCTKCVDFVHTYCSIHGPPLVIPDTKVSAREKYSSYIPHAALTIPHGYLHLAWSVIPGAGLGVFCSRTIPHGVRFGPYRGQRTNHTKSSYCWQIYDENKKPSHVIDAMDANRSNWMRYVNCSRHWGEQNLIAYQYQGQIYYSTIKTIPKFTELLVFYGSEFANLLNINLSKYNDGRFYKGITEECQPLQSCLQNEASHIEQKNFLLNDHIGNELTDSNNVASYQNFKLPTNPNHLERYFYDPQIQNSLNFSTYNNMDYNNSKTNPNYGFISYQDKEKNIGFLDTSMHLNDTGFTCDLCGKFMKLKSSLRRHLRAHSRVTVNRKPQTVVNKAIATAQTCGICNKVLSNKENLRRHKLIHLPVKRFSCDHCNFATNEHFKLIDHLGIHTKEIEYRCHMCNYFSYTKFALTRHKRIHKSVF